MAQPSESLKVSYSELEMLSELRSVQSLAYRKARMWVSPRAKEMEQVIQSVRLWDEL